MRTPEFWYRESGGALASLLSPVGFLYARIAAARLKNSDPKPVSIPVICIGNILSGGTGKTPVALSIARKLQQRSLDVHFLTRGYGGNTAGPLRVDPAIHNATDVGDEALLLCAQAPTWVAADRHKGAEAAVAAGAAVIIMDDGFQNPGLRKDFSILVFNGADGLGNGHLFPAGPLRETFADGLERAQAAVIIGEDKQRLGDRMAIPVLSAALVPDDSSKSLEGQKVVAFAGIGRPGKFFDTLAQLGCVLAETHPFADHHPYQTSELTRLKDRAETLGARLVTTTKDAARLPTDFLPLVSVIPVSLHWTDEEKLDRLLDNVMNPPEKGGV
ncbi:MAG: tetraacyldisaccharide 4'-kinase [Proteobacteria bacterium]|nr:tetraacyldisaccharide 4'-kinase [Pseudomonadota bacterium]